MLITFFTRDGQFITDKFQSTEEARNYLEENISPIMIEDIESLGMDRAAIFIPNAEVSLIAGKRPKLNKAAKKGEVRLSEVPDKDPSEYESINSDEVNMYGWKEFENLMLKGMSIAPETDLSEKEKKMTDSQDELAYSYFKKNVDRLYNNPDWTRYKKRLDSEKRKNF